MWAILTLLVENKPGILFKVTHLFRSRNFNIDSISVGVTDNPEYSRMTITTYGDEKQVEQIVKQLDKMIDTLEVRHLDEHKTVYRELSIFKIKLGNANDSMEVNKLANAYGGKIHDVRKDSMMVELTATPDQIRAFEELVKPFGIIDVARTGVAALQRSGA
ncbi:MULTISPECIES: acetolactate synthase small subunit [Nitrosarchaeum]|jgi:acetolactate synthase-1/3 small subunit|uniref:Acetolactate synthase small subunit n=1 Tax=Nitrosarchaeum koreense MY1 TaxID=1001994 RepID=F9CXJ8_9ARCH|nr:MULTISPECIES: acetolactate synthase small subunit [Nitrosarchaeum]EGP94000.1 Acetolactate synthase, small subunit [Nitrosarchaeum koreense MY1]MBS3922596.1 acetolactate synthase small subunit [Nitrosarchaeum sp.]MBS3923406.1 acetolactate synthase small subunit [Nitrosarchaeum sp.]MCV0411814.1 acetolactate synthase small subunit [Nitrosarchaeum sp.]MEC4848606.1 acetolactate synthase small subunit [Nitrosarchaeum sp.]